MNGRIYRFALATALLAVAGACSQSGGDDPDLPDDPNTPDVPEEVVKNEPPEGKEVYIPYELRNNDFKDSNSQWCWTRTKCTDDIILFWAKGFGDDLSNPPTLGGNSMKVDADRLLTKAQEFYNFYSKELQFTKAGSTIEKYRMMIMLDYSLEGTAYGGNYDNVIGALWVAPNRVQDKNMNAVAHEIGHSFQFQIFCDKQGDAWGGGGFYEMTSQWMLWNVNPLWTDEERFHFDEYVKLCHKAFLHGDNIYHSPFVIECWGEKNGLPFIAEMYRQGKRTEDQVMTYKKLTGLSQEEFNDEMWHNYAKIVNMDFDRVRKETRPLVGKWKTTLKSTEDGWKRVDAKNCPENYGFNAIPVTVTTGTAEYKAQFKGEAGINGYYTRNQDKAGWRYGFLGIDSDGVSHVGEMYRDAEGEAVYKVPEGKKLSKLWFIVMGAPTEHWKHTDSGQNAQWPYSVKF